MRTCQISPKLHRAPPPRDRAATRRPAVLSAACGALAGALCLWGLLLQSRHPGIARRRADAAILAPGGGRAGYAPPAHDYKPTLPGGGGAPALRSADGSAGAPRPAGAEAVQPKPRLAAFVPDEPAGFNAAGSAAAEAAAAAAAAARAREAARRAEAAARLPQHREPPGGAGDGTPKVALLFLTVGALPHEPTWRAFFEAAGRLSFAGAPPRAPPPPALADTLRGAALHPPLAPWPEEAYPDFKMRRGLGPWAPGNLKRGGAAPAAEGAAGAAAAAVAAIAARASSAGGAAALAAAARAGAAAAGAGAEAAGGAAAGARGVARDVEAALRRRAPSNLTAAEFSAALVAAARNERLSASWPVSDGARADGGGRGAAGGLEPGVQAWEAAAVQREVRRLMRESPGAVTDDNAAAATAAAAAAAAAAAVGGGEDGGGLHPLITNQRLFSVYVHPPPGKYLPAGSFFSGLELPEALRANTTSAYLQHATTDAEVELLRAAAFDRSNVKFVMLSETSIPVHPPEVIYAQLMAEEQSRVDACLKPWRQMTYNRWHPGMRTGHFTEAHWRKSLAWFALTRAHADLLLADTHVSELFRRWCATEGRDGGHVCISDEHLIPSLLASYGLDFETDCRGQAHFTDWSTTRDFHPRTFRRGEVWAGVAAARGLAAACGAAEAAESARKLFRFEPAGGDAADGSGGRDAGAAAPPGGGGATVSRQRPGTAGGGGREQGAGADAGARLPSAGGHSGGDDGAAAADPARGGGGPGAPSRQEGLPGAAADVMSNPAAAAAAAGDYAGRRRPAPREWAAAGGYLPLGYECALFARKFEAAAAAEVAAAALSCAGVGLGAWCAAARGA